MLDDEPGGGRVRVLVVGGYGLIGSAVVRALIERGVQVTGAGRHPELGAAREPSAHWIRLDLADPASIEAARSDLHGMDAVINAAGALQDTGPDRLDAVHHTGLEQLLEQCRAAGVKRIVQISAPGAHASASTAFLRTKARGDASVRDSGMDFAILRPGLVLGPESYGSSTLLRALAALPALQPIAYAQSPVRFVALDDVAREAANWAVGERPLPADVDLVADTPVALGELVAALRTRLGFGRARIVSLPGWTAALAGWVGDGAGLLGWRSPLRSTAMRVMSEGIDGDPEPLRRLTGASLLDLDAALGGLRGLAQERTYAAVFWLRPLIVLTLSIFWLASGIVGLFNLDTAANILVSAGLAEEKARAAVLAGSLADIGLGIGILVRGLHRPALWGMVLVTLGYLVAASLIVPGLWADPLGPLVKTIPALMLTVCALGLREQR